ncbi:MAG: CBS domain-containing protein [Alphaproteobacteria bacterium]|nr:CBS domain-containing protein [Alphaproteobacteria bacterium]
MNVREILDLKGDFVLTIQPEATIGEAAAVLAKNHIGAIFVTDAAGAIAGILSERDVAVSLPRYGAAPGDTKVSEIMTADVVTCNTETTVKQVLDIMVSNGIRHLPVVESDALKGVVSIRDVVGNWLGAITGDPVEDIDECPLDPFEHNQNTAA